MLEPEDAGGSIKHLDLVSVIARPEFSRRLDLLADGLTAQ
jgi:hypothetical protein